MSPRSAERAGAAAVLLRVAGFLYGLGARIHRAFLRRRAAAHGRVACAVVSVGALTVGGAGKTPVAARLARGLARRGHRVVLASRGYRGASRERVLVVSDGTHIRASVEDAGDEPLLLAAHAPGVPVLVGRDRRIVGHHAVSTFDAEILVLDDGFQHHRLSRDLDIVCLDGRAGLGNGRVLPAGPLREPVSALAHADWLCVVDGEGPGGQGASLIARYGAGLEVVHARRRPRSLTRIDREQGLELASLGGKRVGLLAGIARPASLRATLEALGAKVVAERCFPDHHRYRARDLAGLDRSLDLWVTTEKDALKILPRWVDGVSLFVLTIEAELDDESDLLARVEQALRAKGRLDGKARAAVAVEIPAGLARR